MSTGPRVTQMHQPRLAHIVAQRLRERILNGDVEDGGLLPKQELLASEYGVSPPSVREALRVLETEGLVTVRRGNRGGAIVRRSSTEDAARTIAMVLQANNVVLTDVRDALAAIEPICCSMAAERPDRNKTLVPALEALNVKARAAVGDATVFSATMRQFHRVAAEGSGNETMYVIASSIEALWYSQGVLWPAVDSDTSSDLATTKRMRLKQIRAHEKITAALSAGDASLTARHSRSHLEALWQVPSAYVDRRVTSEAFFSESQAAGRVLPDQSELSS